MEIKANTFVKEVQPNSVATFVELKYVPTCQVPCAVVNYNGINYALNPWSLIELFEVDSFEELEDVHKHTKILYKGFTTAQRTLKDGSNQEYKILKFEKLLQKKICSCRRIHRGFS